MDREFAMLPDNFREVKAAFPELSKLDRLRFHLQTFWIIRIEGTLEYLSRFLWLERIRYKLSHDTSWGCILFWDESDNFPYRIWYKTTPLNMQRMLTSIAGWNFKQRVRFLIGFTVSRRE